jgi:hypothetical protein
LVKLKTAFSITSKEALTMVPSLPHCLFSGGRRDLDWVAQRLTERGVATKITLEPSQETAQSVFVFP